MKLRNHIGKAIQKKRLELSMTQKQLAEKCGIMETTISKIENAKFSPSADLIEKISTTLNLKFEIK